MYVPALQIFGMGLHSGTQSTLDAASIQIKVTIAAFIVSMARVEELIILFYAEVIFLDFGKVTTIALAAAHFL